MSIVCPLVVRYRRNPYSATVLPPFTLHQSNACRLRLQWDSIPLAYALLCLRPYPPTVSLHRHTHALPLPLCPSSDGNVAPPIRLALPRKQRQTCGAIAGLDPKRPTWKRIRYVPRTLRISTHSVYPMRSPDTDSRSTTHPVVVPSTVVWWVPCACRCMPCPASGEAMQRTQCQPRAVPLATGCPHAGAELVPRSPRTPSGESPRWD